MFKKITDKTKLVPIVTIFSLLNLAKIAPYGLFTPYIIASICVFQLQFDDLFIFMPYLIISCMAIYALCTINLAHKIIINAQKNEKISFTFKKYEVVVFLILAILIIYFGFYPHGFFGEYVAQLESF